jgi:hypothetical protein
MINLLEQRERVKVIEDIKKPFNIDRKAKALYRSEIQNDNIKSHVIDELKKELYEETVKEMPVVSTINIQKRVVRKKACVYTENVTRTFEGLSEDQEEKVLMVYADGKADVELNKCNKKLIYEHQTILGVLPRNGKLMFKKYELHQLDAVPNMLNPEHADIYVMSVFDREDVEMTDAEKLNTATGSVPHANKFLGDKPAEDNEIASKEDYKKRLEKYIWWSDKYHFMTNGHGEILDLETGEVLKQVKEADLVSPLAEFGVSPFIDISREKDGAFWNYSGSSLSDFTVQFNAMLSDLRMTMKMEGYNVAILKAPSDLQPATQVIGASMLLKLPTDDPEKEIDFKFESPNSNISQISDAIDRLLNYFITTEDLDSSVINSSGTAVQYQSGWDRFLALTEKREANKEDYQLFKDAEENQIWHVVKAWLNVLSGTDTLDKKYHTGFLPLESEMEVNYEQSNALLTEKEKIENMQARKELMLESRTTMLMKLDNISREEAEEQIKVIDETNGFAFIPPSEIEDAEIDQFIQEDDEDEDEELEVAQANGSNVEQGIQDKDKLLNGAQVTAVISVVEQYKSGLLEKESAIQLLQSAFGMEPAIADTILGDADNRPAQPLDESRVVK